MRVEKGQTVQLEQVPLEADAVILAADKALASRNPPKAVNVCKILDSQLCKADFCSRLCLVKIDGDKLWPALKFQSTKELLSEIKKVDIPDQELAILRLNVWKISRERAFNGEIVLSFRL